MSFLTRLETKEKCATDLDGIIASAKAAKTSVPNYLQSLSPKPDNADDTKACLADILYMEGVRLSDDPEHGLTASSLEEVKLLPPHVQTLYSIHIQTKSKRVITSFKQKAKELKKERDSLLLARSYTDEDSGSPQRPYADVGVFNSERPVNFPPPEVIFADTRNHNTTAVRVIESKPLKSEALVQTYGEGAEINVYRLDYNKELVDMKRIASGVDYSHEQDIAGELTSELLSEYMDERGAEVINRRIKEMIGIFATKGAVGTSAKIDMSKDEDGLAEAVLAAPKQFIWTTVLGREPTVRRYLTIDRAKFRTGSYELPLGSTVGEDRYGRAFLPRYVADVPNDYGIAENDLLFLDASEAGLIHILEGSELETQEFINRTRMNEVIWSATMGVSEKYPSQTDPTKRPYRLATLGA